MNILKCCTGGMLCLVNCAPRPDFIYMSFINYILIMNPLFGKDVLLIPRERFTESNVHLDK